MKTEFMATAPKNWRDLEPHPLSALVAFGTGIDMQKVAAHMRVNGYDPDEPIIIFEGRILDGRHRHIAAQEAGVVPTFKRFVGTEMDARAHVLKKVLRQHLTVSQLGLLAGKLANLPPGNPKLTPPNGGIGKTQEKEAKTPTSVQDAAEQIGVPVRTAERGRAVAEHGTEKLQEAVASNQISLSDAAAIVSEPPRVQNAAVNAVVNGQAPTARAAVAANNPPAAQPEKVKCPTCRGCGEISAKQAARLKFTPPTLEEVAAYCKERKNKVDPEAFMDHYTSNGWKVGKNPMQDWKGAVRTWERNNFGGGNGRQQGNDRTRARYDPKRHG